MIPSPRISVVVPAFNESRTVTTLLDRIIAVRLEKEIIVVDDCSTDATFALLEEFSARFTPDRWNLAVRVIRNGRNLGRSNSLIEGFRLATAPILIPQDADLEYDPGDYHRLVAPIEAGKTRIVYGTRFKRRQGRPFSHLIFFLGNRFLTMLFNLIFGTRMTDIETCYKVIRRDLFSTMDFPPMRRFEFCPYLTSSMTVRGERIIEVPVSYNSRSLKEGKKAHWIDAVDVVRILFQTKFHRLTRFKSPPRD